MVLECYLCATVKELIYIKSGIPIDVLLVVIKLHLGVCSYLFEHMAYLLLLLRRYKNVTTSALEILVASEVETECSHELVILLWEHMLLEVGESSGEYHRLFVMIVCTSLVFAASGWIEQTKILFILLQHHGVSNMMQASSSHRATAMLTYRIVYGKDVVSFFGIIYLVIDTFNMLCYFLLCKFTIIMTNSVLT